MTKPIKRVAVVGTGVIGSSWITLFLANGLEVDVFDVIETVEKDVRAYVANAWPTLEALGRTAKGNPDALRFFSNPGDAVREVDFVQESVPERLPIKHSVYAAMEETLPPHAIVATSSSGLVLSDMQRGWRDPSRFMLAHPFNPPHLIPLVELYGNDRTSAAALDEAEAFYAGLGKISIRLKREVPGHVANRLQAALWREAINLVIEDVASLEDIDKAVWAGPGLRWAVMGPHMLLNLGGGPGGMQTFCDRLGPNFEEWWDDLGAPRLTPEVVAKLVAGVADEAHGKDFKQLAADRDKALQMVLAGLEKARG